VSLPYQGGILLDPEGISGHGAGLTAHLTEEDITDVCLVRCQPEKSIFCILLQGSRTVVHDGAGELGAPIDSEPAHVPHLHKGKKTGEEKGGDREDKEDQKYFCPDG